MEYTLFYKLCQGKKIKVSTGFKSKISANKILQKYETKNIINRNLRLIKFSELQNEIINYISIDYAPGTVNIYKNTFKHFIHICKNNIISNYNINDVIKFRNELAKNIQFATVNIYLRTLRSIFNFAIRFNYLETNPAKSVKELKIENKIFLAFTEPEKHLIINSMNNNIYKDIIIFAFHTGFRLNEILNVQIKDIDFKNKTVITYNKNNFKLKTSNSIRIIPISDFLFNVICNRINNINNIYDINIKEKYLFENKKGNVFDKSKISKMFKCILRKLNFDECYHFHCTRHTFASELAKKGIPINDIAVLLGQKNIEVTKMYLHSEMNSLKRAVNYLS